METTVTYYFCLSQLKDPGGRCENVQAVLNTNIFFLVLAEIKHFINLRGVNNHGDKLLDKIVGEGAKSLWPML